MKRIAKEITLKEDTLNDINSNNIDTNAFIERINSYLEKAYYLINNRMVDMKKEDLYKSLSEVFYLYYEPKDYLKLLSQKYGKHYSRFININTNMYENDSNVSYLGAATNKIEYNDGATLNLDQIRKSTDSYDLLLLKPRYNKNNNKSGKKEKFESHLFDIVNVNNGIIDKNNGFYPYACNLLEKEMIVKYVLYDLKLYVDEVLHQVRSITSLAFIKDNDTIANIGKQYKKAYDSATNDCVLPKKEKVSVRYHQKTKTRKNK